jgi:chorismate dehydratase
MSTPQRIACSAVAYHNTRPFLHGLQRSPLRARLDLQLDIPSEGAAKLRDGRVRLGLVPVAVLEHVPGARIVADWCIGCDGPVQTVALYGQVPVERMRRIHLDYHSMTSVRLLDVLLRDHWGLSPERVPTRPGYRMRLSDGLGPDEGALVIGDRAIGLERRFGYVYDLGEVWKAHTGLPFAFAVWAATTELDADFRAAFNAALADGVSRIDAVVAGHPEPLPEGFDLGTYLRERIDYPFDAAKRHALSLFLERIGHRPVPVA